MGFGREDELQGPFQLTDCLRPYDLFDEEFEEGGNEYAGVFVLDGYGVELGYWRAPPVGGEAKL